MKLRLTQRGLDFINGLAADTMNKHVPNMILPNVEKDLGAQGHIKLANVHIISFKKADSYQLELQPPTEVVWKMENMNIGYFPL